MTWCSTRDRGRGRGKKEKKMFVVKGKDQRQREVEVLGGRALLEEEEVGKEWSVVYGLVRR
jgi:hypothetical protein